MTLVVVESCLPHTKTDAPPSRGEILFLAQFASRGTAYVFSISSNYVGFLVLLPRVARDTSGTDHQWHRPPEALPHDGELSWEQYVQLHNKKIGSDAFSGSANEKVIPGTFVDM